MRYESDVISKNIKRNQKIKKFLFIILYIMLIPTILFSLLLIFLELGNSGKFPSSLNIEVYTVTSESMKPRLNINDIVIVKKGYSNEEYKIGNIITFKNSKNDIMPSIHSYFNSQIFKNPYLILSWPKVWKDVIGKVIYTMPKFGSFVNLLKNEVFFSLCIIVLFAIALIDNKQKRKTLERKQTREKYEKKSDFYF